MDDDRKKNWPDEWVYAQEGSEFATICDVCAKGKRDDCPICCYHPAETPLPPTPTIGEFVQFIIDKQFATEKQVLEWRVKFLETRKQQRNGMSKGAM